MNHLYTYILVLVLASSCITVDVERRAKNSSGLRLRRTEPAEMVIVPVPIDAEPVLIEKPVYVPPDTPASPPVRGRPAVEQALKTGTAQPQDYSNSAMLYDFNRDFVYEVYCQPLRVTDLILKPGEKVVEAPFISDSERWMLGAGISYEGGLTVQHIYVKPTIQNIEASLIINTSDRVYHIILRSFSNIHMPMVRWRYPETVMPQNYSGGFPGAAPENSTGDDGDGPSSYADSRFLSFNYRITYGIFKKPRWLPTLAYDDGKKTYITFPDTVLQTELPAVFENRAEIVNYRVARNVMIIDKLVQKITVKIGGRQVEIVKKRGP
ncbi:MAG: TrbG/VirB9 family P-type conjugative transfer protein [Treponema sp.]|jgi:type IV secretion system protein VirB9|nr:TrbG/VirB9 family P-type conjugative transfer protein [Treponema sp.]